MRIYTAPILVLVDAVISSSVLFKPDLASDLAVCKIVAVILMQRLYLSLRFDKSMHVV